VTEGTRVLKYGKMEGRNERKKRKEGRKKERW
jgi:hypothetical protein